MVLDPNEFLEIANQLYEDKDYQFEGGWRTIVSRAYYSSFLASMKKLEELGTPFSNVDRIHQEVIEAMMDRSSPIANKLETLRKRRVDADYKLKASVSKGECPGLLRLAQLILDGIAGLK